MKWTDVYELKLTSKDSVVLILQQIQKLLLKITYHFKKLFKKVMFYWSNSFLARNTPKLSMLFCHLLEEIETKLSCLSTSCGRGRQIVRYSLTNSGLLVRMIDCLQGWSNVQTFYRQDALVRQKSGKTNWSFNRSNNLRL